MPAPTYESRKAEYARLWAAMEIRSSKAADIDATAQKIVGKKTRYSAVASATGVPWYMIGLIHAMEAGCNFACHLHNGDSLARRTVQVPAGRPREGEPPFQWKDSAIDAVRYDKLDQWSDWSIEGICYALERFNGWGYVRHHPEVNSPYLWSGSTNYARGKYVADGKWSSSAVSGQSGAMPILKRIIELDPEVRPVLSIDAPEPIEERVSDPALAFPRAPASEAAPKRSFWQHFTATKINELVDLGSRVGTSIRAGGNAIRAFLFGTTVVGGGTVAFVDPNKGLPQIATKTLSPYPVLIVVVITVMVTALVIGGIAWWYFHRAGRGLVSAAKDNRYAPRGAGQEG